MEGHYVDMAELCPEYLEEINAIKEEAPKASKLRRKEFSNILDWVQAFSIYMTIMFGVSLKPPGIPAPSHS